MISVKEIAAALNERCPFDWQEDFDNSGLQVGDLSAPCRRILLALDCTAAVVREAIDGCYDLIVSHHPLLFAGLKQISATDGKGRLIYPLIEHKIALLSLHTNLDKAPYGVSAALAARLGLQNCTIWQDEDGHGLGVRGELPQAQSLGALAATVRERLQRPQLKYCGDPTRTVRSVALLGGSGAGYIEQAIAEGIDVYISGDFKYHDGQRAAEADLCLIDGGHYHTEIWVLEPLQALLQELFTEQIEVKISEQRSNFWSYV